MLVFGWIFDVEVILVRFLFVVCLEYFVDGEMEVVVVMYVYYVGDVMVIDVVVVK